MPEQRVEARFDRSMAVVFAVLTQELGEGRWRASESLIGQQQLPQAGLRFGYRQNRRLYSGEVVECLRPVSISIVERYRGPAGAIVARQRWRVEPVAGETRLVAVLRVEPNHFARLQLRFWMAHFTGRARHVCTRVATQLRTRDSVRFDGGSARVGTD